MILQRLVLRDVFRADFRFDLRTSFFRAVFRFRALPSRPIIDFMTACTAASAAAVAAAVAALTSIFCTRATPDFAAPTIVRWVFCAKLLLAIHVLQGRVTRGWTPGTICLRGLA
jgi:hypothetical protein